MTQIRIDRESPVSPSGQVAAQIVAAIRSEALSEGQRLPSVRQVAADLGVAPNTIVRAWRLLEDQGWVTSSRRRGVFVASPLPATPPPAAQLNEAAQTYLAAAAQLGFGPQAAIDAVAESLRWVEGSHQPEAPEG